MSRQRNVAQQNAETLAEIRQTALRFAADPRTLPWLASLLRARGLAYGYQLDPGTGEETLPGILACLGAVPEQEGELFHGIWLSAELEFWAFSVLVPDDAAAGTLPAHLVAAWVERFDNVTPGLDIAADQPGTGHSFGYLALEVLREVLQEMLGEGGDEQPAAASGGCMA